MSIIGRLLLAASMCHIWIERNNRIFKQVKRSSDDIHNIIMVTVRLRLLTFRFKNKAKILSIIRISVDKQFGCAYLKEIFVRQANQKDYVFSEADFSRLHLNYIKDRLLLYVQNKLHHLKGDEKIDLINALRLFTRRIVIKKRVEDVQLGVESYQIKLNIIMPQITCVYIDVKEPYNILYKPK
ncbi:hypothetical protein Tco_1297860, partial [Tanacetum coccineum]